MIIFKYKNVVGQTATIAHANGVFQMDDFDRAEVETAASKHQEGGYPTAWHFVQAVCGSLGGEMITPEPVGYEDPASFLVH